MDKKREVIPNKLYFRIGEVSDIVRVKPYVLRYWESEFSDIKPSKSKSGQRLYKRRDVEMLVKIKELLYDERFTINGARKRLKETMKCDGKESEHAVDGIHDEAAEQLDVFEEKLTPRRALPLSPRPPMHEEKEVHCESSKVLLKIRRDLESLLQIVRN